MEEEDKRQKETYPYALVCRSSRSCMAGDERKCEGAWSMGGGDV